MKNPKILLFILFLFVVNFCLSAEETEEKKTLEDQFAIGLILNSQFPTGLVGSYQGGIGFKFKRINIADFYFDIRLMLDIGMTNGIEDSSYKLGTSVEFPFFYPGRINPYAGLQGEVGVQYIKNTTIDLLQVPSAVRIALGIEIFTVDFISVFIEYTISFELKYSVDNSLGSSIVKYDWNFDAGLGNAARIGIIIYFQPVVRL